MTDDYASIFLNSALSSENPLAALSLLFLFLARMLPIISLSPFFGARVLPHPVKVTFALCLFAIFLPHLLQVSTKPLTFNLLLVLYMIKEVFIGFVIGWMISLPFAIVQSSGIIIDHQRGGASLMVNDPTIQNQSSPLGTLFNMVLIYIFFILDGPFLFIDAIITSYEIIPPDQFINIHFFDEGTNFWAQQIRILNKVMVVSIQLATPALLAILMTDMFLGIANRLAPQVQITFLGMPLKSLLGLGLVCLGWQLFCTELSHQIYYWISTVANTITMLKPPIPP
jgi:type III secretion protein SpaR/YscT/HrcT